MPNHTALEHAARVQDQFSRQALAFAAMPSHSHAEGLELLAHTARLGALDDVLDVACGPGLVACAFASRVHSMRGLDVVDTMLQEARRRATAQGANNVHFDLGDSTRLPYADGSFSRVLTRYSFHHLLDPEATLREMIRVCRPGGTLTVCDACPARANLEAYNRLERVRDPSHAAALAPEQLVELFERAGLQVSGRAQYRLENSVEEVLAASFPNPGDTEKIREMFEQDLATGALGVGTEQRPDGLWFWFPISILSATVAR